MADMAGFIRIIIPAQQYVDSMPYIPERKEPGIDQEKQPPSQEKYKQGDPPNHIAEINDILSGPVQWIPLRYLKIDIYPRILGWMSKS
jgi:hypothetical protein